MLRYNNLIHICTVLIIVLKKHILHTVPAKVTKGPDSVKGRRGTTVVLKAEISGEPPPDVGWLKDGNDIEEDDR